MGILYLRSSKEQADQRWLLDEREMRGFWRLTPGTGGKREVLQVPDFMNAQEACGSILVKRSDRIEA